MTSCVIYWDCQSNLTYFSANTIKSVLYLKKKKKKKTFSPSHLPISSTLYYLDINLSKKANPGIAVVVAN